MHCKASIAVPHMHCKVSFLSVKIIAMLFGRHPLKHSVNRRPRRSLSAGHSLTPAQGHTPGGLLRNHLLETSPSINFPTATSKHATTIYINQSDEITKKLELSSHPKNCMAPQRPIARPLSAERSRSSDRRTARFNVMLKIPDIRPGCSSRSTDGRPKSCRSLRKCHATRDNAGLKRGKNMVEISNRQHANRRNVTENYVTWISQIDKFFDRKKMESKPKKG